MKRSSLVVVIAAFAVTSTTVGGQEARAAAGLDAARAALGGARALSAIKSIVIKATWRMRFQRIASGRAKGGEAVYHDYRDEIHVLLPDHFLRAYSSGSVPGATREGFAGRTIIGEGLVGRWRNPETFGYLMLSLLTRTDTVFPFTLRGMRGDAIEFADPNGVAVLLDLDLQTSLPRRLRFDMPARGNDGQPTGGAPVQTVIELSAYKSVGGLRLPHRLTTSRNGVVVFDHLIESIQLNPPLTPRDFSK